MVRHTAPSPIPKISKQGWRYTAQGLRTCSCKSPHPHQASHNHLSPIPRNLKPSLQGQMVHTLTSLHTHIHTHSLPPKSIFLVPFPSPHYWSWHVSSDSWGFLVTLTPTSTIKVLSSWITRDQETARPLSSFTEAWPWQSQNLGGRWFS